MIGEEIPEPSNPMAVARHLLPDWQAEDGTLLRRRWRGSWMAWQRTHWAEVDENEVRAALYRRLEHCIYPTGAEKDGVPELRAWAPTKQKIGNLLDALAAVTLMPSRNDAPGWTGPAADIGDQGPIVACGNGLLRIRDRELLSLTPDFFNLVSVPFPYQPGARAPTWTAFLAKVWPGNPEAIRALQQWFGYVLSGRTDQQKILMMVGPSRSGKGTIARVLKELVGKDNLAGPTLAGLGTNFGLATLIGKPLAIISDARLAGGGDNSQVVERLLTISGEDTIDIDRKYRQQWTGKLPTRLMLLSNELPHFGDSSGVIARRFIVLSMTVSWLGKEDPTLFDRLRREMPGILNWALEGLADLEAAGRITEPVSSREAVSTMQDTASPTSAFVRERCTTGAAHAVPVDALWAAWREWAEDNGVRPGTKQVFGRNLQSVIPQLTLSRPRGDGARIRTYTGIGIRPS